PEQTAVITTTRTLSYADLSRRATELGHWLRERGARPNTLVAVVMEKGWEQVVAALGVLESGAAYLPIDPSLPAERLHYLLDHGQVALALTQSWLDPQLAWPNNIQRLCVDTLALGERAEQPLQPAQQPTDLAYVIYTSGSTGLPKGVMIDHRGAVNTILDLNARFGVAPRDRVLALSSLSFDLSVYDIFGLLAAGGAIVMPDAAALRDPRHWAQLLSRERVTIWNSVPALMEMFVEYVAERPALHPELLRLVMLSGDWIPLTLPDRIKTLSPNIALWSLGGATEASIWSILYPIERVDPGWKSIPYGRPMLNQQFHVLSESFEPAPTWVPGQLYIGGIGLAQGYWRDPEKTAASFITHPRTGERLYRAGDLGRYLPDGNIEFLGREDFQLKIQGYRIELGEIEAALAQHRLVRSAVVNAVGERQGSKRLVAYVVPEHEATQETPPARLLDPRERLQFKRRQPGLRHEPDRMTIPLLRPELDAAAIEAAYIRRRSYRRFLPSPVPFEHLSLLLSNLAQLPIPGAPAPKYRYSSAGSLYPVQIYLHVKSDRVAGLSAGAYYYDPAAHQLVLLTPDAALDHRIHGPANRALFDDAAFSIFLVAQLSAITPMYGADSLRFATLEAGVITQLLEGAAPDLLIGLCQTGTIDVDPLRRLFALEESHVWLHGLVGGAIDPAQTRLPALLADAEAYHELAALVDPTADAETESDAPLPAREPLPDAAIVAELREFLKTKLPAYMLPSAFVLLDTLPLSANGKVDRKALPSPEMTPSEQSEGFVAPQSQVEQTIARLLCEVLQLPQVGVNDNFFDLGGNSIHLVQMHGKLQSAFNVEIPLVEMFKHPTIRALASYLSQDLIPPAPPPAAEPKVDPGKQRLCQMLKRSSR
ncbi:MAG TPA: amino acid adenylation domain-containing protein, partial [Herpetosiphonaceae bacterium]